MTLPSPPSPFGPDARVAVIGAGISGVTAAAHLLREGLAVTLFERSGHAGGVWQYDERIPHNPPYPNSVPSRGDYETSAPGEHAYQTPPPDSPPAPAPSEFVSVAANAKESDPSAAVAFAPPGPAYVGLCNNVPTSLMGTELDPWPAGTEEIVPHGQIVGYIQALWRDHGVEDVTLLHTRVEQVTKSEDSRHWLVRTVTRDPTTSPPRLRERTHVFDAVVVASGHYNMPRVPDFPGLRAWQEAAPERVLHSKQYRTPARFRGQNVLVIGAGVSSTDVCRELETVGRQTFQSVRGGAFDIAASMLPPNATRVAEVERFVLDEGWTPDEALPHDTPVPGTVILKDGTELRDIHQIVVATGYITSYPFLSHLHDDTAPQNAAGRELLVTGEGEMLHNLHKDIFYVPDPSLCFVGVPYFVATFSLFDHQAQAVARVLAGRARLPEREAMLEEYDARLRTNGFGRLFHSLRGDGAELEYVRDLVEWINREGEPRGLAPLPGHSEEWVRSYWVLRERIKTLLAAPATAVGKT